VRSIEDPKLARPLVKSLRRHVDAFAVSMAGSKTSVSRLEQVRPAASSWVYFSLLVAWAEDHGLIDPWLRAGAEPSGRFASAARLGGPVGYLSCAFTALAVHPATWCLLDPRYSALRDHTPSQDVCRDLLDWWAGDAPALRYEVESGPETITGWVPGDVLQYLRDSRKEGGGGGNAQTPWWICDGILDRTLVPAAGEFRDVEVLRTVDPACGTGHFLIRKIGYLWEWYTTGSVSPRQMKTEGVTGGATCEPAEAVRRILLGVDGCEIDPLTAAVARLRVAVALGELLHRSGLLPALRLDSIPPGVVPRIVVGDSLLAGKVSKAEYAQLHPKLADIQNLGYDEPPATALEPEPVHVVIEPVQLDLFSEVVS
jgi:hypothetical protein